MTTEYRANLPRALELVHRRCALQRLGSLGITLAKDASWEEIYDAHEDSGDDSNLMVVEYGGQMPVGNIFDRNDWVLDNSLPTEQSVLLYAGGEPDSLLSQAEIFLRNPRDVIRVWLIPDVPPVAMYDDDIWRITSSRRSLNDMATIGAVQKTFGDGATEFISESAARSLIDALARDNPHVVAD